MKDDAIETWDREKFEFPVCEGYCCRGLKHKTQGRCDCDTYEVIAFT